MATVAARVAGMTVGLVTGMAAGMMVATAVVMVVARFQTAVTRWFSWDRPSVDWLCC